MTWNGALPRLPHLEIGGTEIAQCKRIDTTAGGAASLLALVAAVVLALGGATQQQRHASAPARPPDTYVANWDDGRHAGFSAAGLSPARERRT